MALMKVLKIRKAFIKEEGDKEAKSISNEKAD